MIHSCWKAVERSCHNSIYKASFPVFFSLVGMLVIFKTSHVTIWGPGKIKRAFTSIHTSYSTVSSRPKSISCSPRDSPSVPFNWRPVPCAEKLIQSTKEPSTMRGKVTIICLLPLQLSVSKISHEIYSNWCLAPFFVRRFQLSVFVNSVSLPKTENIWRNNKQT